MALWQEAHLQGRRSLCSVTEFPSLLSYSLCNVLLGTLSHLFLAVTVSWFWNGLWIPHLSPGAGQLSQCPLPSRNGLPVRTDGHRIHQSPDGTLLIHNLRARDEGSYTCSAYRGSQAVSRSTEVKVGPPGKKGLLQVFACS